MRKTPRRLCAELRRSSSADWTARSKKTCSPGATRTGRRRYVERFLRDLLAGGGVDDADAVPVVHELQVRSDREVVDADQRRFDRTDRVEVHDLEVAHVGQIFRRVDVTEDPP